MAHIAGRDCRATPYTTAECNGPVVCKMTHVTRQRAYKITLNYDWATMYPYACTKKGTGP